MAALRRWLLIGSPSGYSEQVDLHDRQRMIVFQEGTFAWDGTTVSGTLYIDGTDADWLYAWHDRIQNILNHAARSAGPLGHGERVTIGIQQNTAQMLVLDITGGRLTNQRVLKSGSEMLVDFAATTLTDCARAADPLTVAFTTQVNGAIRVFVEAVPGTAPAFMGAELDDVSTGSVIINELTFGIWGDRDLQATGYPAFADATAVGSGIASVTTDTVGGHSNDVGTSAAWQTVGEVALPERGEFDIYPRISDSADATGGEGVKGFTLTVAPTGGFLTSDARTYIVAILDGSANVIALSPARTTERMTGTASVVSGSWIAVTGTASKRVYQKKATGVWQRLAFAGAAASFAWTSDTDPSIVNEDPPTAVSASVANTELRLAFKLPSSDVLGYGPVYSSLLANGRFEAPLGYSGPVPFRGRTDVAVSDASVAQLQAISSGTNTETLKFDGAWVMPRLRRLVARYQGLTLATKRRWWLMPDRDGAMTGELRPAGTSNAAVAVPVVSGRPMLDPGNSLVVIMAKIAEGASDVTDAKLSGSLYVWPRWRHYAGSPWSS